MRRNVLLTWTAASLVLTALLMTATATTMGPDEGAAGARRAPARAASARSGRRTDADAVGSRHATALLLALMVERGRIGDLSR